MYATFPGDESGTSKRARKRRDKTILQIKHETHPDLPRFLVKTKTRKRPRQDQTCWISGLQSWFRMLYLAKGVDIDGAIKLVDAVPQQQDSELSTGSLVQLASFILRGTAWLGFDLTSTMDRRCDMQNMKPGT